MPILFRDEVLDRLERSTAYLIFDRIFNWLGGVGELLLIAYGVRVWWESDGAEVTGFFWLKLLLLGIALLLVKSIKDSILAWAGIAPPDYPKSPEPILPVMKGIIDAQYRGDRIQERGIRVDELLEENHAKFLRLKPCIASGSAPESGRPRPFVYWMKWILVLPAAIGACVGIIIFTVVIDAFVSISDLWIQFFGGLLCPVVFVLAGTMTAPAYRRIISICLTIVVALFSVYVAIWTIDKLETRWELVWMIILRLVGIAGAIGVCYAFRTEKQEQSVKINQVMARSTTSGRPC